MNKPDSPCKKQCCLNENDICIGCFRTLEEIKEWGQADTSRRNEILLRLKKENSMSE